MGVEQFTEAQSLGRRRSCLCDGWWTAIAVLLLYVRLVEKRKLQSLGFRRIRTGDVVVGLGGGVVALAGVGSIFLLVFPFLHIARANKYTNSRRRRYGGA